MSQVKHQREEDPTVTGTISKMLPLSKVINKFLRSHNFHMYTFKCSRIRVVTPVDSLDLGIDQSIQFGLRFTIY